MNSVSQIKIAVKCLANQIYWVNQMYWVSQMDKDSQMYWVDQMHNQSNAQSDKCTVSVKGSVSEMYCVRQIYSKSN